MQLEISIEALLNKEKVESNRIEFKEGWNPDDIYRSICAFANDFDSQGGGYILIGVEEKDGVAVRPVIGVPENILDKIQKEMVGFDKKIIPAYSPRTYIEEVDGKKIIAMLSLHLNRKKNYMPWQPMSLLIWWEIPGPA